MKNLFKKIAAMVFCLLIIGGGDSYAQTLSNDTISSSTAFYIVAGFVFIVALLVLFVSVAVLRLLRFIVRQEAVKKAEEVGEVLRLFQLTMRASSHMLTTL